MEVYIDDIVVKNRTTERHSIDLREVFHTLNKYWMKFNPNKCAFRVGFRKFLRFMLTRCGIEANPKKIDGLLKMKSPQNVDEVYILTG